MPKYDTKIDTVFQALSDQTRRAIVDRLSSGPASVGELAKPFDMALPSFMQHVKLLENGDIIRTEKVGRVRVCKLQSGVLDIVDKWLRDRRAMWEDRIDALEDYLEHNQKN